MALAGPTAVWVASGQREARPLCGAMIIVARDTGLITPGKKNIYNAIDNQGYPYI